MWSRQPCPSQAAKQNIPILLLALAALASLLTLSPLQEGWSAGADAPGLVAAYSFDEGSGSTTEDETGNGRTGTVSGAGWTSEGRFGGALVFDGHNDLVSVADADGLHLTGAMTLEAWVKPTDGTAGWRPAIVKMLGGNRDYALYATSEGGGPSGHVHSSAGEQYVASASAVAVGSWSHVAMTYDGSRIDVYVNGSAVASHPASGAVDASTDALQIGGNAGSAEWFAGAIDEVRVYNRALSSPEIAADMAERLGGPSAVAPANQQAPVVSGTPEVKSTLSASPGSWSGTAPMSFTYAWFRCDAGGSSCSPISGAAEQTYTLAQADAGATLRVQVTASNEAGSQSATSAQTPLIQQQQPPGKKPSPADTQPPTTPTGLALALRAGEATLTWKPAMDDVGVSGYGVYKDGARIASTATESYVVSGLLCGSVVLGIDAFDAAGNRSAQATVTTPARPCSDVQAPTAPTSLRVTRQTDSRVSVAWDASSDDVAVTGYGVYRDDTRLDTAAHTTYTFTGLSCGRRYVLDVDAFDAAGNRSAQATVAVDTARCTQRVLPRTGGDVTPPTAPERLTAGTVTSTSVGLEWAASVDNVSVAGYGVYFGDLRIASTAQTGYAFSGLNCGSSYIVGVDAYDQAGNRSTRASAVVATAACSDTAAPTTPLNVVQGGATQTSISIAWNGSTDNVGVSGYGMYRADTRVATTSQTSYTFSGLTCGSVRARRRCLRRGGQPLRTGKRLDGDSDLPRHVGSDDPAGTRGDGLDRVERQRRVEGVYR